MAGADIDGLVVGSPDVADVILVNSNDNFYVRAASA